jgi:hypothetical protein
LAQQVASSVAKQLLLADHRTLMQVELALRVE